MGDAIVCGIAGLGSFTGDYTTITVHGGFVSWFKLYVMLERSSILSHSLLDGDDSFRNQEPATVAGSVQCRLASRMSFLRFLQAKRAPQLDRYPCGKLRRELMKYMFGETARH